MCRLRIFFKACLIFALIIKVKRKEIFVGNRPEEVFCIIFASNFRNVWYMWHEYIAYLIIAAAVLWIARRMYRLLAHPEDSACMDCTADCKLRGLKRPTKKEKQRICAKREEKTPE